MTRFCILVALAGFLTTTPSGNGEELQSASLRTWKAPDGNAAVLWERIGPADGPTEQFALTLVRSQQAPVRLEEFWRDVDLAWSDDSKYIVFTDFIGSNFADCYVVDAMKPDNRIDVADLLPNLPEATEAHEYVTCEGWRGTGNIAVRASGHTDSELSHDFDYHFIYSIPEERLSATNE